MRDSEVMTTQRNSNEAGRRKSTKIPQKSGRVGEHFFKCENGGGWSGNPKKSEIIFEQPLNIKVWQLYFMLFFHIWHTYLCLCLRRKWPSVSKDNRTHFCPLFKVQCNLESKCGSLHIRWTISVHCYAGFDLICFWIPVSWNDESKSMSYKSLVD